MTSRRVLITGSRNWTDQFLIHNVLTSFHWMLAGDNEITLVSGACPTGADLMCELTAMDLGWEIERHAARWDLYEKAAGPIRNQLMVSKGADICLAFILDGSKGATHCADMAEKAGIYTQRYRRWSFGVSPSQPVTEGVPEPGDPDILRGVEVVSGGAGLPEEPGDNG